MTNAFEELEWRGLVFDSTEGLSDLLAKEKITIYNGFDPSVANPFMDRTEARAALEGLGAQLADIDHPPLAIEFELRKGVPSDGFHDRAGVTRSGGGP